MVALAPKQRAFVWQRFPSYARHLGMDAEVCVPTNENNVTYNQE
jgi:hypothetical protein